MQTRLLIALMFAFVQILLPVQVEKQALAADVLRPFLAGEAPADDMVSALKALSELLPRVGLEIVGEYEPYPGTHIIIASSDHLRDNASRSDKGGFGAVLRFSLCDVDGELQFAAINPVWMANSYRLKDDLNRLRNTLASQLGLNREYGSKVGKSAEELRKYHYMMMMPYFDDQVELAKFGSQKEAISTVMGNLKKKTAGCSLVYRVDLKNGDVLLGVGISEGKGSDKTVMDTVDIAVQRHGAHLPYEMLIQEGKAYALHAKFRIANSFPDLTMGTFMKIVAAPGAIEKSFKAVCGVK